MVLNSEILWVDILAYLLKELESVYFIFHAKFNELLQGELDFELFIKNIRIRYNLKRIMHLVLITANTFHQYISINNLYTHYNGLDKLLHLIYSLLCNQLPLLLLLFTNKKRVI